MHNKQTKVCTVPAPHRRAFWTFRVFLISKITQSDVFLFGSAASPVRLPLWGARVGPPAVKGSPEGGFITLVWRAESELVLWGKKENNKALRVGGGEGRK